MGEDQLDDLELDGPITLRISDGMDWDFSQAKLWRWWKTVKYGGLISSCLTRNPGGKVGNEERKRLTYNCNIAILPLMCCNCIKSSFKFRILVF